MITLGIETSCDETAVAILADGALRANLIARQEHLHERYGGVVPEIAARAHVEALNPLLARALEHASIDLGSIDGVAVTVGPGLVGALLVGMAAAKAITLATGVPLLGVNHLEGHYWANFVGAEPPEPPFVALIVSGGHTMLVHVPALFHHVIVGQTLDDAAGEAFDKVARLLGLGFPGRAGAGRRGEGRRSRRGRVPAPDGGLRRPRLLDERPQDGGPAPRPGRAGGGPRDLGPGPRRVVPGGDRRRAGLEDDRRGEAGRHRDRPAGRRGGGEHVACATGFAPTARPRASAC